MSEPKYPNMFQFIKNILSSYVTNVKNTLGDNGQKLNNLVTYTDDRVTSEFQQLETHANLSEAAINNDITNLENIIVTEHAIVNTKLQTHQNNKNNPHEVKFAQTSTVSQYQPTSGQGKNGDVWVEYIN